MNGMRRHVFATTGPKATPAVPVTLAEAGIKERTDLQEWVIAHPEVIGDDVCIVTAEYDQWAADDGQSAKERLDVLGLDASGRLVVVELKRGSDPYIHQQAITYAAMAAGFSEETLAAVHAAFLTKRGTPTTAEQALALLRDHAGGELDPDILAVPRIVLVASNFPAQVATTVLFLTGFGLDITLCQVQAYSSGGQVHVIFDPIYPTPGIETAQLTPARKQAAAATQKAQDKERATSAARTIVEEGLLEDGTLLTLTTTSEVVPEVRAAVTAWVEQDPARGTATWVNNPKQPLLWSNDGQAWQPTTLIRHILKEAAGIDRTVRGTAWWVTEEGENLAEVAGIASGTQGRDWSDLHELIETIGPGEWASYGDLGEVLGLPGRPIGTHIGRCGSCPDGAWRVLAFDGRPSGAFHWPDPKDTRSVQDVLASEGLKFTDAGRAEPTRRLTAQVLKHRSQNLQ